MLVILTPDNDQTSSKGLSLARERPGVVGLLVRDVDKHFRDLLMICQRWMGSNKTWDTFNEISQIEIQFDKMLVLSERL